MLPTHREEAERDDIASLSLLPLIVLTITT